jgi:hypothetical protein
MRTQKTTEAKARLLQEKEEKERAETAEKVRIGAENASSSDVSSEDSPDVVPEKSENYEISDHEGDTEL